MQFPEKLTALMLVLAAAILAQTRDTASIFGTVTDTQGAIVAGASVRLTNSATSLVRTAETNEAGSFNFPLVPVGSYELTVERAGFRQYRQTAILARANDNIRVDASLELGDIKQQITVEANASQVETRSSTLGQVVESKRVIELPLNGRNPADLTLLSPGVAPALGGNTGDDSLASFLSPKGQKALTANGSRNNNLRFTLDGGEHMDPLMNSNLPFPFPEAVQEFSVQTSNMTPEMGASSAGAVNVVTKSGTNEYHGSGFWFVRNTAMNARNFFSHQEDDLKRNQMGFTVGGPLLKNRIFGFFGYQKLTIRQTSGSDRATPLTAAERAGDFSAFGQQLYDPNTGQAFEGNQIPASRISPAAKNLLAAIPLPDADGFYRYSVPRPENGAQYVVRGDYQVNQKNSVMLRYLQDDQAQPFNSAQDNIYLTGFNLNNTAKSAALSHNFIAGPSLVIHSQFTATHFKHKGGSNFEKNFRSFGININPMENDMQVDLGSGAGFYTPYKTNYSRAAYEYLHDWIITRGNHTMSWGGNLTWRQYNEDTSWHSSGYFSFDGHATAGVNSQGYDRADFLLGQFSYFQQNNGELENRRQMLKGVYFNDVWRVNRNLTLTVGVRYEPYRFYSDTKDRVQLFYLENYLNNVRSTKYVNAPPGLVYPGDKRPNGDTVPHSGAAPDNNNFAPHIGFAWDPTGAGKLSLRGGYAIFYDSPPLLSLNNANNVSPFSYSVEFTEGLLDDPFRGREDLNRFPVKQFLPDTPFASPLYTIVMDPTFVMPYTQNWNVTLEREVIPNLLLRVGYVGTKTTHLKGEYDLNAPVYNYNLSLSENQATINERRPVQGYQNIIRMMHGLGSIHNALQVTADKRLARGYTATLSYTWSRTIDYLSQNRWGSEARVNPFNFNLDRGLSDFHRTHRLVASAVWDLPSLPKSTPLWVNYVAGGWRLSGILTAQSGRPFNIGSTGNPMAGAGSARAVLVGSGNPILDTGRSKGAKIAEYFDVTRFRNADPGTWGTLGRNSLIGPGYTNFDTSLVKVFPLKFLRESASGELRGDFFNVLNSTHLGIPETNLTSEYFGQILYTAGDPRILQLGLKISF